MEKVDRLGWTVGFGFLSSGVRIGVRLNDPSLLEQVRQRLSYLVSNPLASEQVDHLFSMWAGGASQRRGVQNYHLVFADASRLSRCLDIEKAISDLVSAVEAYSASLSPEQVLVPAKLYEQNEHLWVIFHEPESDWSDTWAKAGANRLPQSQVLLHESGRVRVFPSYGREFSSFTLLRLEDADLPAPEIEVFSCGKTSLELVSRAPSLNENAERVLQVIGKFSLHHRLRGVRCAPQRTGEICLFNEAR